MRVTIRRFQNIALLLPALVCSLAGCENGGHFTFLGYTTQPTFDTTIQTVYVPMAQNVSYRPDIEFDLTRLVVRELGQSPYRVTSDRARADTELVMKIINRNKSVVIQNQLGETRDAEYSIVVEVVWRDLRPGRVGDILSNPKRFDPNEKPLPGEPVAKAPPAVPILVTPTGSAVAELGGSTTSAEWQAMARAAVQIVSMMETWR